MCENVRRKVAAYEVMEKTLKGSLCGNIMNQSAALRTASSFLDHPQSVFLVPVY